MYKNTTFIYDLWFVRNISIIWKINIMCDCNWKWTSWYLDFYQTVWNLKSMYIFIITQLFTFGSKSLIVGTQTIVNKNWTTYSHRLEIQRFKFSLNLTFLPAHFLFDNLIITFWKLFLVLRRWQSSIFLGSTYTSSFCKTFKTAFCNLPASVSDDILDISKHLRLEYCSLVQHLRSTTTAWSFIALVTDLDTLKSASSLLQFFLAEIIPD